MPYRWLRRVALLGLVAASSCVDNKLTTPGGQLQTAWAKWSLSAPVAYQMTFQKTCFCSPAVTRAIIVVFRNHAIESAKYADNGADASAAGALNIDGVFSTINDALGRNAATISASYDPVLGYPLSVFIDYNAATADDELTITISNFQVL